MKDEYPKLVDRLLRPNLLKLGFEQIRLKDCISYERLFRREGIWFGTSWDYRDRYLDLDLGPLFWLKDVMPRVIALGRYSAFVPSVKKIDEKSGDYLQLIVEAVAGSIELALKAYVEHPEYADAQRARLRPLLLGEVKPSELVAYEA